MTWVSYVDRVGPEAVAALEAIDAAEAALASARIDAGVECRAVLVNGKALPHRRFGRVKVVDVYPAAFGSVEVRFFFWTRAGAWSKKSQSELLVSFLVDTDPLMRTSRPVPPITAEML